MESEIPKKTMVVELKEKMTPINEIQHKIESIFGLNDNNFQVL